MTYIFSHRIDKSPQAVAWAPQRGNNNSVELPSKLPKDDYLLKDLEPLGWIKTQALELPHLSPSDITTQAKIMADHPEWGSSSICITAAFTPGSVSLSAHSLTVPGFEWGRKNQDTSPNPQVRIYVTDPLTSVTDDIGRASTRTCRSACNCCCPTVSWG